MTRQIGAYARVSTAEQNLDRQINGIAEYAQRELAADLPAIEVYRDKSTGTDVERDGYQQLLEDVENGEVDVVVVYEVSRIARSIRDLDRTVERVRDAGAELHIVSEGLVVEPDEEDPYQTALFQLLGVFAELEAKIKRQNIREGIAARQESEEYRHGPAPLGFEKDDGQLVEGEDYQRVVAVLEDIAKDEMSKRQASKELDTSRRTIQRSVEERRELYGL
jgi:DNA invertase Pin-like site-specific DNA recombinase